MRSDDFFPKSPFPHGPDRWKNIAKESKKSYWKLVADIDGRYFSINDVLNNFHRINSKDSPNSHCIEYKLNTISSVSFGKIFIFNSKKNAIDYSIQIISKLKLMKVKSIGKVITINQVALIAYKKDYQIKKFWENKMWKNINNPDIIIDNIYGKHDILVYPSPKGTLGADAIIPIEIYDI